MLTLYHAEPLANSMKVLLTLEEKGLSFESRYVNLHRFEQHDPEFVAINPAGQVPVLVHNGAIIVESTVINEYLDEVFPDVPLLPGDPVMRARARAMNKFVDDVVMPSVSMIAWHYRVRKVAKAIHPAEMERMIARIPLAAQRAKWRTIAGKSYSDEELGLSNERIAEAADRFETALVASEWLGGAFSLADISAYAHAGAMLGWFPEIFSEGETPCTCDWANRMAARPAVQRVRAMPNHTSQSFAEGTPIQEQRNDG
jgi:glutathione S-transferase